MSDGGGRTQDPVAQAAARLEAAVERLTEVVGTVVADRAAGPSAAPVDAVSRAEVAALADRFEATLARLRGALAEQARRGAAGGDADGAGG